MKGISTYFAQVFMECDREDIFKRNSLKFLSICLIFFVLLSCKRGGTDAENNLKILLKGSDTGLPISQKMAEEFMYKYPDYSITVVGGGSGVGISALRSGITDIAISSRSLKIGEKLIFKEKKIKVKSLIIGYDALAVVVHPSNPINQLTREQLEDIFTGKVSNWKSVGGDDKKIVLISRESSSGTFEFFKDHVMNKKNFAPDALMISATGGIIQSVAQNQNAIAYVGLAYLNPEIKALKVSYDSGSHYILPSMATAKDKSYPISRPLFFFYPETMAKKLQSFLDYTVSPEGQKNVEAVGYVPIF